MNIDVALIIINIVNKNPVLREKFFHYLDLFVDIKVSKLEAETFKDVSLCAILMPLAGSISQLIINNNKKDDSSLLKKIFQDIEEEIISITEPDIENDFEICFFESLLNSLANESEEHIETLSKLLGPKSRELCIRNDEFWGTQLIM